MEDYPRTLSLSEAVPDAVDTALSGYTPLTRRLLFNRGITDEKSAQQFFSPDYEADLHDPFLLTDMDKAVTRILHALQRNEHICIYSDYDCDGIPGGVLLHDFFCAINYNNFENYIPHRHEEGYGFNEGAVKVLAEKGTSLIITVDCGIVDFDGARCAKERGVDVIITDHHERQTELPEAFAVINPKRDNNYPFKGICGTGVAFKLVQAILAKGRASGQIELTSGKEKWLLDMVGIATVADMVPLVDENRTLVHYGLHVLRRSPRPGLQQLLRNAKTDQRYLSEDDIGFTIAPRINAASRMDNPEDAFNMLRVKDEEDAGGYVAHLEKLNNERKGVVASMTREANKRLRKIESMPAVIVIGDPLWRPSLVGLVAGSVSESCQRPVFAWGKDGKGIIKGSCRSDGSVNIVSLMEAAKDLFLGYGGHERAGGFSVHPDEIYTLEEKLSSVYNVLEKTQFLSQKPEPEAEITLADITPALLIELMKFAPYGNGNQKPLFKFVNVPIDQIMLFGKTKNHTRIRFAERNTPQAIAFFKKPEDFSYVPVEREACTLFGYIEESYYQGRREIRIRIHDIEPPSIL